jgi:PTH1 family peptidyl-tRNA hydrolase
MTTRLIAGLGNPGPKYQWTRHNAGFMVLDRFSRDAGIPVNRKVFSGLFGEGTFQGARLLLLKPQTFMNLSGRSVAAALNFHKIPIQDLIVIHDDLDIPFGQIRLKDGGGHAGHNGIRSLMQELGSGNFIRLRIGINRPLHDDAADYVLSNFSADELEKLSLILDGAVELLKLVIEEGPVKAMNTFHNRELLQN